MNTKASFKLATFHVISATLLAGSLLALIGCTSCTKGPPRPNPIALTLKIQSVGQAANLTIPVYVGAANQLYDKGLLDDPVDQILERIRSTHSIDIVSFQLTTHEKKISTNNPIWSNWLERKRDYVVIIADLPKNFGGESKRRVKIPLDKKFWRHLPSDKTVHVAIHEGGVELLDAPGF